MGAGGLEQGGLGARTPGFSPRLWEGSGGWWVRAVGAGSQDSWVLSPGRGHGREAKGHGRKDPGVPQLLGFKEYAKKEAELKQKRVAELRARQEQARLKETSQRRSLESLQQDALRKQRDFEQKVTQPLGSQTGLPPPDSWVLPQLWEGRLLGSPPALGGEWGLNCVSLVLIRLLLSRPPQQQSKVPVAKASCELLASGACVGADCLLKVLANYSRSQDLKTAISVGVVGFPNVGKSSLINSLKRSRACSVGATPGVTKCLQEVQLDRHVKLLDCPGLVMATAATDAALVLRSCLKVEQVADPVTPVDAILRRCSKEQIMQHYGVPAYRDVTEFLAHLARRKGKLRKGGVPDHEKAAKAVLSDWMSGKISYFTAEIVTEMGKAFDFEALEQGNQEALSDLPSVPVGIGLVPAGLTSVAGAEMEEEETSGEEETAMDEDRDLELGPMTVELKAKNKAAAAVEKPVPRAPSLEEISALDPLHQGQGLRAASRRRKKQQKRAEKIASKLSATLTAAMNFGAAGD
uniref:G protein nucleolar 3 like n=1 Tax=Chrysemys picta bellii TaxID=8478 RepID=A0A8C3HVX3_CHRPI